MSDIKKTFHEIALESILFKGQSDWYFCLLKTEKVAHVLAVLAERIVRDDKQWFERVVETAADLPYQVAHFAAGDINVQSVLADIFAILASIRMSATRGYISQETALYIVAEYERVAEKLVAANKPSPFITPQDFSVPEFTHNSDHPHMLSFETGLRVGKSESKALSYSQKGHEIRSSDKKEIADRSATILNFVLENKAVSIKDISKIVPGCSEKTVQRELISLISKGLIKREGERRWSVYKPA